MGRPACAAGRVNVANILLCLALALGLNWGVAGVAWRPRWPRSAAPRRAGDRGAPFPRRFDVPRAIVLDRVSWCAWWRSTATS